MEIWKQIDNLDYEVSNRGRVKSLRVGRGYGKILKLSKDTKGYLRVRLYTEKYRATTCKVHRLVAKAFIGNLEDKPEVNHIDGCRSNNIIGNLEWVTSKENTAHRKTLGNWTPHKGVNHGMSILSEEQVKSVYYLSHNSELTQKQIGDKFGVGYATVSNIKLKKQWAHVTDKLD